MRIIAIDMGFSRVGIAIGSTEIGIAFPYDTIAYDGYIEAIQHLVQTEKIEKCILGNPESLFTDELSEHQEKIFEEKEYIQRSTSLEVIMWNEQFTTQLAERQLLEMGISGKKQKGKKDALAACAMLQEYFDMQK